MPRLFRMSKITALIVSLAGVTLCYISFLLLHTVHDSVLYYFAQSLIYAAAIFGITLNLHNNAQNK